MPLIHLKWFSFNENSAAACHFKSVLPLTELREMDFLEPSLGMCPILFHGREMQTSLNQNSNITISFMVLFMILRRMRIY